MIVPGLSELMRRWYARAQTTTVRAVVQPQPVPERWSTATTDWEMGFTTPETIYTAKHKTPFHKSMELLKANLTPAQWESYILNGWFEVTGNVYGRTYRILHGYASNVWRRGVQHTFTTRHFCLIAPTRKPMLNLHGGVIGHLQERLPMGDHLLMQKLTIELEEEFFLEQAISGQARVQDFDSYSLDSWRSMIAHFNREKLDPKKL